MQLGTAIVIVVAITKKPSTREKAPVSTAAFAAVPYDLKYDESRVAVGNGVETYNRRA